MAHAASCSGVALIFFPTADNVWKPLFTHQDQPPFRAVNLAQLPLVLINPFMLGFVVKFRFT